MHPAIEDAFVRAEMLEFHEFLHVVERFDLTWEEFFGWMDLADGNLC